MIIDYTLFVPKGIFFFILDTVLLSNDITQDMSFHGNNNRQRDKQQQQQQQQQLELTMFLGKCFCILARGIIFLRKVFRMLMVGSVLIFVYFFCHFQNSLFMKSLEVHGG